MKQLPRLTGVGLAALTALMLVVPSVQAFDLPAPQLVISEINITGEDFVVIVNKGAAAAELNQYWLGYAGKDTLAVPSQVLPDDDLQPGQAIMLANGSAATCGAALTDHLSFSLANTSGSVALWQLKGTGSNAGFSYLDGVSWGKDSTDIIIGNERLITDQGAATWLKSDGSVWQVGGLQDCMFTPVSGGTGVGPDQQITWASDPAGPIFVVASGIVLGGKPTAFIPAGDIGLKALQLSEILPNAAPPATDATAEFIELYNPNSRRFDLGGFQLQSASATSSATHSYRFPAGTTIAAHSFQAFYSAQTHLSLSNSGGQVWLIDPLGNTVSHSAVYSKASDGQAWLNAGGQWQWTASPTPNAANKLAAVLAGSTKSATVNGHKLANVAGTSANTTPGSGAASPQQAAVVQTVHPLTLAVIAGVALLYAAYEYRHDLANKLYQFRSYRAARRSSR